MNDRFKFRSWHEPTKTMEYNGLWTGRDWDKKLCDCNFKLMQCTGLKDKNGKLIYEGDILKFVAPNRVRDFIAVVEYLDNINLIESDWFATGYFAVEQHNPHSRCDDILTCSTAIDYKVIGNIYENKELLNE